MKKTKLLMSLAALALVLGLGACETGDIIIEVGDVNLGDDTTVDTGDDTSGNPGDDGNEGSHVHEYEITDHKDATCTEGGYITYTCKDGDDTYTKTIDALGHDWGEWVETKPAECETAGEETRTCSRCDATETRDIEALGHDYEVTDSKEATCTETGYTTYTCKNGGETYTDTIAALGHDWGEWVETKPAECETAGEETRTCSRCDATETRDTATLEHNYVDFYDAEGHWSECTICGDTTEKVAHEYTYTTATNEHYHVATCECGYSYEDLHQLPDDTATACACGAVISCAEYNYSYDSTRDGYLITGYANDDGAKETEYLPAYHDGNYGYLPVVGVGNGSDMYPVFYQWPATTTFYGIPDSYQILGDYAFADIDSLTEVAFSENSQLTNVGKYAFRYTHIGQIVFTSDNVEIGTYAFDELDYSAYGSRFAIAFGPYGSIGSNAFDGNDVNVFYRGTSEEKTTNIGTSSQFGAEESTWYYEGQWELVNHVPTVIS